MIDFKIKRFKYTAHAEKPLNEIHTTFANHERLRVFHHKGTTCVTCGIIGTRLIQGKDKRGTLHWDVYAENGTPLTVDHIIPKSKGGSNKLENLQPMCTFCNSAKGNGESKEEKLERCLKSQNKNNFLNREICFKFKEKQDLLNFVEYLKTKTDKFIIFEKYVVFHTKNLNLTRRCLSKFENQLSRKQWYDKKFKLSQQVFNPVLGRGCVTKTCENHCYVFFANKKVTLKYTIKGKSVSDFTTFVYDYHETTF